MKAATDDYQKANTKKWIKELFYRDETDITLRNDLYNNLKGILANEFQNQPSFIDFILELERLRSKREHLSFPPAIHHLLSVQDNGMLGPAKKKYIEEKWKRGLTPNDSIERSLILYKHLWNYSATSIRNHFGDNFFLGRSMPKKSELKKFYEEKDYFIYRSILSLRCMYEYCKYTSQTPQADSIELSWMRELLSDLDGRHWDSEEFDVGFRVLRRRNVQVVEPLLKRTQRSGL